MKRKIFAPLLLLISSYSNAETIVNGTSLNTIEIGEVFYIPFYMSFMTPRLEHDFEDMAFCRGQIEKSKFKTLLTTTKKQYNNDPRVKIKFMNDIYYIDQHGVLTNHKKTFELKNIEAFIKTIQPLNDCLS